MVTLAYAANETQNMFLRSLGVFLILLSATQGFPSDGRRYNQRASWSPLPLLYQTRSTRPYAPYYYDSYSQEFTPQLDLYYLQDAYDKYRYYPYYHEPMYYPEQYLVDEEESPEEDEASQQDPWYTGGNAEANAAFLQNLVLAQLFKDPHSSYGYRYPKNDNEDDRYVYGEQVRQLTPVPKEDKDVKELKSLVDNSKQRRKTTDSNQLRSTQENRWMGKRQEDTSSTIPAKESKGQDEVLFPRPSTPVRTPSLHHRAYQPSVYGAIKKLLIQQENESSRQPQKRSYVLPEDSLVEELGNLKKI